MLISQIYEYRKGKPPKWVQIDGKSLWPGPGSIYYESEGEPNMESTGPEEAEKEEEGEDAVHTGGRQLPENS